MLYGIQTGFGSPQVPVAELLARPAPTLMSPQSSNQRPKSSNFLQVPDIESPRPKSVPSSPMVKRAFSRLGTITAGWGRSIRSRQSSQLQADDKKKWASSHDCSSKLLPDPKYLYFNDSLLLFIAHLHASILQIKTKRAKRASNPTSWQCRDCQCARMPRKSIALSSLKPNSASLSLIRTHFGCYSIICTRAVVHLLVSPFQVCLSINL